MEKPCLSKDTKNKIENLSEKLGWSTDELVNFSVNMFIDSLEEFNEQLD